MWHDFFNQVMSVLYHNISIRSVLDQGVSQREREAERSRDCQFGQEDCAGRAPYPQGRRAMVHHALLPCQSHDPRSKSPLKLHNKSSQSGWLASSLEMFTHTHTHTRVYRYTHERTHIHVQMRTHSHHLSHTRLNTNTLIYSHMHTGCWNHKEAMSLLTDLLSVLNVGFMQ